MDEAVRGIPIDANEKDPQDQTLLVVRDKEATPEQLQSTSGGVVATQEDEVRRLHDELKNEIQGTRLQEARTAFTEELGQFRDPQQQRTQFASLVLPLTLTDAERIALAGQIFDNKTAILGRGGLLEKVFSDPDGDLKAQKARLARILLPLKVLQDERQTLERDIAQAKSIDKLLADDGPFEAPFKKALGQTPDTQKDDYAGKRAAIAHLLVNIGRSPKDVPSWYERVEAVVGFRTFAWAATQQAATFRAMTAQVDLATRGDLHNFVTQHQAVLSVLRNLDEQYRQREIELAQYQGEQAQLDTLVKERRTERDQYVKDLEKARENLQEALAKQHKEENMLTTWREQLSERQQANETLLRKIRDLEKMGQ
jgi:hypothetical protein